MASLRRSMAHLLLGRNAVQVIEFIAVILVARLLTPTEVGIYAVAASFVALAHVLRDFGLSTYLVREPDLDHAHIQRVFGLALTIAWVLGGLLFLVRHPVADFYAEPALVGIIGVLTLLFLVLPFGSVTMALLTREQRFGAVMKVRVAAAIVRLLVTVWLAWDGHGPISMAWGALAGGLTSAALSSRYRDRAIPWAPRMDGWGEVLRFSSWVVGNRVVSSIAGSVPDLLLGRLLGFSAVALFSRANGLLQIFSEVISHSFGSLMLTEAARRDREDESVAELMVRGQNLMLAIAWPFFAFVAVVPEPLIFALFGSQWLAAAPIVSIFALRYIVGLTSAGTTPILNARGRVQYLFWLSVVFLGWGIFACVLGARWGLEAVAMIYILGNFGHALALLITTVRETGASWAQLGKNMLQAGVLAIVTAFAAYLSAPSGYTDTIDVLLQLMLTATVSGFAWLGAVIITRHPMAAELHNAYVVLSADVRKWRP